YRIPPAIRNLSPNRSPLRTPRPRSPATSASRRAFPTFFPEPQEPVGDRLLICKFFTDFGQKIMSKASVERSPSQSCVLLHRQSRVFLSSAVIPELLLDAFLT